ncbi:MAG TPA: 23S rRNA (uracil(1939)-C(5))-methyltransferase RlmD [Nevskiaceae bacterium]|nr:23S rRNA (uracil(1939)-C(5))-methyltransferase RlmD [Nevskiaceae bacterium]
MSRRTRRRPVPQGEFSAEVVDLAADGRGVARVDGKVIFLTGALPGERVRFRLTRTHHDTDEGLTTAVELASPQRVVPRCAHFEVCGGCALQHLAPEAQIAFKQKQLLDVLARVGQVVPEQVAEPVTGPAWAYRRRARLGVRWVYKKDRVLVGFRERTTPKIAVLSRCEILDARVGTQLEPLAEMIGRLSIRDKIPQIEVATSAQVVALVLRVMVPPSEGDRVILQDFAVRHGDCFYLQSGGANTVRPLSGTAPSLDYSPDGSALSLAFQPLDFVQINGVVSQKMVRQALAWLALQPGERVLELFSGLGNFSLPLAAAGAEVTAVEGEAALVQRARDNAARNGLSLRCVQADLFQPDAHEPWLAGPWDAALLDPPRAGAREILPLVAAVAPPRIVYVSCHPGTLARDAALLADHGYRLARAGVLDMFPHTAHVESMALFTR